MSLHDYGFLGPIGPEAHGTRKCFAAGCRCTPCRAAESCYQSLRQQARARGETAWIDAGRARAHLLSLEAHELGTRQIAALAGVRRQTIQAIRDGRPRITSATEARILSVKPVPADGLVVGGYRTHDYLRRLKQEGYSDAQLSAWLQVSPARLARRFHGVRWGFAVRVRRLFQSLTAEQGK